MPGTVYWGWHGVDGGKIRNTFHNFKHWAIRVKFDGDEDIWYENNNTGGGVNESFVTANPTHETLCEQLASGRRTRPFKIKELGRTNATRAEVEQWMAEYASGRIYDLAASQQGLAAIMKLVGAAEGAAGTGNCQTMVWHLAGKMRVLKNELENSDYSGASIIEIPRPRSPTSQRCDVTMGMCSYGSWKSVWCGKCGQW
eukprot:Transcript_18571.p1 GENE.Transcript_18571~~Transcript_18571.p1  ORF type:complete len:199 (-),score=31.29 Transcript_18571:463-1059(-)